MCVYVVLNVFCIDVCVFLQHRPNAPFVLSRLFVKRAHISKKILYCYPHININIKHVSTLKICMCVYRYTIALLCNLYKFIVFSFGFTVFAERDFICMCSCGLLLLLFWLLIHWLECARTHTHREIWSASFSFQVDDSRMI